MRHLLMLLSRGLGISPDNMTFDKPSKTAGAPSSVVPAVVPAGAPAGASAAAQPEWANGLRQLYESVVDEPIPDAFKDLLAKLDTKS